MPKTNSRSKGVKLLPCPFCGNDAEFHAAASADAREMVWCLNDLCRARIYADEDAVKAWNKRSKGG